jgi:hypothetical protein
VTLSKITRRRRSSEEIFIDKLTQITKGEQTLIQNSILREALGWNDEKYSSVRAQLRKAGRINVGQGQGGKVGLSNAPNSKALQVFVSYSHLDSAYKTDLLKHIDPLRRLKLVEAFHDGLVKPGQVIESEIAKEMEKCDLVLLLVSIDFLNSYFCVEVELEKAMERHNAGTARVIPVILRSCLWKQMPFSKLKALPEDGKAVSTWSDRDEAMVNVAEGIREVAQELLTER